MARTKLEVYIHEIYGAYGAEFLITFDCWTDVVFRSYLGVTLHFFDQKFRLQTRLIAMEHLQDRETSAYLLEKLGTTLKEWKLEPRLIRRYVRFWLI